MLENNSVKPYFVCSGDPTEDRVVRELQPDNVLLSYAYWNTKDCIKKWIERIGYRPKSIMMDSGAFTAKKKGGNHILSEYLDIMEEMEIDITTDYFGGAYGLDFEEESGNYFLDYMTFLMSNGSYIDKYVSLDVIGDPEASFQYYKAYRLNGLSPMPVVHYGADDSYFDRYIAEGATNICLGGTVFIGELAKMNWVQRITSKYPEIRFHLLGCLSNRVLSTCTMLDSSDGAKWIMMAINGKPKHVPGDKYEKAKYLMKNTMELAEKLKTTPRIQQMFLEFAV